MSCYQFDNCQATTSCAYFSLYQSYYAYWKKTYSITKINRMYYNAAFSSPTSIAIVFSYNYVGQTNGSFWGLAYFNPYSGQYTFALPLLTAQNPCEQLSQSVIEKLPIGVRYNFVEYVKNCH
jgi:hypothetical protein